MKTCFLVIFLGFISKSCQQLQEEMWERLFGSGEIHDKEHKEMSEGHICSSMDDLLKLCQYEKSIQDEISKLPYSGLKEDYVKLVNTDVNFLSTTRICADFTLDFS